MSSHPIGNGKVLLVNGEESVRKRVSERKERVGRQRGREKQEENGRKYLWKQT